MDSSQSGSSVHGIFQARILEWVAISFSRGSSRTQGPNPGLLHCRQTLYHLSHPGSPGTVTSDNWMFLLLLFWVPVQPCINPANPTSPLQAPTVLMPVLQMGTLRQRAARELGEATTWAAQLGPKWKSLLSITQILASLNLERLAHQQGSLVSQSVSGSVTQPARAHSWACGPSQGLCQVLGTPEWMKPTQSLGFEASVLGAVWAVLPGDQP